MNMKNKSKFTPKDIVMILILALIVGLILSGILSYINYNSKKDDNTDQTGKAENLEVNDELVQNLFYLTRGELKNTLFAGTDYENIYYRSEITDIETTDENFKKILSFVSLDQSLITNDESKSIISAEALKNQYNTIFGNLDNYKDETFNYSCPVTIEYNEDEKQYEYESACGYNISSGYISKLTEAKKYDDCLEIYEKVVFYLIDEETGDISYFNTSDYSEQLVVLENDEQFNIDDYTDKLDIYKYTFIKDGNNYYFDRVERQNK